MKVSIILNQNSYPGREYLQALIKNKINVDVITIGSFPEINKREEERCAGLWKPKSQKELVKNLRVFSFTSLKDPRLTAHLIKQKYDIGLQGGTGILKNDVIDKFKLGILNFHPGDLPSYRGTSAPEWQIFEGKPVVSTCHIINEGIDEGDVYKKRELALDYSDYHHMRASLYIETAQFLIDILKELIKSKGFKHKLIKQNPRKASYRKYIGEEKITYIKNNFKNLVSNFA